MSQLSIKVSAKGDALIATLQKEIFNRRRKKVTASQVVETLVESGAKSQSDKRYAASWKNLIKGMVSLIKSDKDGIMLETRSSVNLTGEYLTHTAASIAIILGSSVQQFNESG